MVCLNYLKDKSCECLDIKCPHPEIAKVTDMELCLFAEVRLRG